MWSLSGRLLGEGTVGPFSRPPDRVPCEEHRLESGCGEPLCAVSPLSQPGSVELEWWGPAVSSRRTLDVLSTEEPTLCDEESAALDLVPGGAPRPAPVPPTAAGARRRAGSGGLTVHSYWCFSRLRCLIFPWKNANFLSFISKLEIRGGVSQNFSAVKHECIN